MNKIVIDSSAWIEYFSGSEKGKEIKNSIQGKKCYATGLIAAEVATKFIRCSLDPHEAIQAMQSLSEKVEFDFDMGLQSAETYIKQRKKNKKFGLVDSHIVAAAQKLNAKIITCDNDFAGLKQTILIK